MNETPAIAVIGLACRYPGAATLREFWENVISRRCQFRRLPDCRLPMSEYYDEDPRVADKTYSSEAAVIDGFDFDWVGRGIPKPVFEGSDIVHWLALDVALQAFEDSGYSLAAKLPKERAGVILGNTLTGEYTRAHTMRLRWPFIEKAMRAAAAAKGLSPALMDQLTATTEQYFKSVFPPTSEDTLAGGLSNTIAGRICGYLGLQGGGYTVDGACSSSLIAVATAATALHNRTLDVALAGGVDVSLDTFELIGFSKAGALAKEDLRVYDRRANGFKPGEGCGFVLLKRLEDARADGDYVYATLRGWGIASDGKRAVTAPNAEGQARAIRRAYEHANYGPRDLAFVEGHGTGTAVGDAVELEGISLAMQGDGEAEPRGCGVTSLKSVVGHTKAAAGVGGFIKAVVAANRRVVPPTAGCTEPHPIFDGPARPLYPIMQGESRPVSETLRVGVSAAGFGGINCHLTLESADSPAERIAPAIEERALLASNQQTELFVLSASSVDELAAQAANLQLLCDGISEGELVDLAAKLAEDNEAATVRASVVAGSPGELNRKLEELRRMLGERPLQDGELLTNPDRTIWIGNRVDRAQVGFLFPGQGSQQLNMARTLVERYEWARQLVEQAAEWLRPFGLEGIKELIYRPVDRAIDNEQLADWTSELTPTEIAQPAICLASLLWSRYLERLGVEPVAVGGHSLGELSAFHAAEAFDERTLLQLAAVRGRAMAAGGQHPGTMASLVCPPETAVKLLEDRGDEVVIANLNSFSQTVISGDVTAVEEVVREASKRGIRAKVLPVSNAFHSRHVEKAAKQLREEACLSGVLQDCQTDLFTSIDGSLVGEGLELADHFSDQVVSQVHFIAMVASMVGRCDVFVEVGPGRVLTGLVKSICGDDGPLCLPVESKAGADRDLNAVLACLFVRGANLQLSALYDSRLVRDFVPASERTFIENPCERPFKVDGVPVPSITSRSGGLESLLAEQAGVAPQDMADYLARRGEFLGAVVRADMATASNGLGAPARQNAAAAESSAPVARDELVPAAADSKNTGEASAAQILLGVIEELTGFPPESLSMDMRLIDDLNLDSIKAAELIALTAKEMGVASELDPSQFGNATLQGIADTLSELAGPTEPSRNVSSGKTAVDRPTWIRNFVVDHVETPLGDAEISDHAAWDGQQVVVFCDEAERDVAQALQNQLAQRGVEVVCRTYDDPSDQEATAPDCVGLVAVLPRETNLQGPADDRLKRMIGRLHSVAVPSKRDKRHSGVVAYIQFGGGDFAASSPDSDIEKTGAKALAASLHLERSDLKVRVLDFDARAEVALLADKVTDELDTPEPFAAAGYDADFVRRVPKLRRSDPETYPQREISWSSEDVILVTGGAKGITAECALAIAKKTGARMALVGSSPAPAADAENDANNEISQTLRRYSDSGLMARYYRCNVADAQAVVGLVQEVERDFGPITGVVHGAAVNKPRVLEDVTAEEAYREVAPKVLGTINLCQALAANPPKLFVGLSSIIGISGMWRNGWYGFSNEAMDRILGQFEAEHPQTKVVCLAYSVWDEVGMGFRMGSTDYLASKGIGAIPADEGVHRFVQLFEGNAEDRQVLITARVAGLRSTLDFAEMPLLPPAGRFLEEITYVCPEVELVARAHLNVERDGYLEDHEWKGSLLLPTVFGVEAMSQAVACLTGQGGFDSIHIENIQLERPIVVDRQKGLEIEIRAEILERSAADAPLRAKVGISTENSEFTKDHFSAEFVLDQSCQPEFETVERPVQVLRIDPQQDLYGNLLFQGPRFQRLRQVCSLDSRRCVFATESNLTQTDVADDSRCSESHIGDAYLRDSLLQSVQLLMPQKIALPVRINSLRACRFGDHQPKLLTAVAEYQGEVDGKQTFSVSAMDEDGHVVERLEGYTLGVVEDRPENPSAEELAKSFQVDEQLVVDSAPSANQTAAEDNSWIDVPARQIPALPTPPANAVSDLRTECVDSNPDTKDGFSVLGDVGFDRSQYQIDGAWGPHGERVMIVRWPLSFRDNRTVGGGIYFSNYVSWMGKVRELALSPILGSLAEDMAGGQWGMVTNNTKVRVLGDIAGTGVIETRYWMEGIGGRDNSTMELRFQWRHVVPDGEPQIIAEGQMQITWVRVLGHGQVEIAPLPQYVQEFISEVGPQSDGQANETNDLPDGLNLGAELYRTSRGPRAGKMLRQQEFQTTLEDANLVGNIYFDNYAKWQGRVRDMFFFEAAPNSYRGGGSHGELMCGNLRVQHIREAMPFDRVHVSMGLRAVCENGAKLEFEYSRENPDGSWEKLAFGEQDAVWVVRDADGRPTPAALPREFVRLLCEKPVDAVQAQAEKRSNRELSTISA